MRSPLPALNQCPYSTTLFFYAACCWICWLVPYCLLPYKPTIQPGLIKVVKDEMGVKLSESDRIIIGLMPLGLFVVFAKQL